MAGVASWLLLAVVAPLVLLAPGYLLLRVLRTREASVGLGEGRFETFAFSAALSLAIVVLVGFLLTQTLGLTRLGLVLAYALLLGGLALLVRRRETRGEAPSDAEQADPDRRPSPAGPVDDSLGVPSRYMPAILIGVTLAIVATGALIYDGSQPHSQAYYANASEVEPTVTVEPGQTVAWTIVVENSEQRPANYTLETVRIPQENADEADPPSVHVDRGNLQLEDGEEGNYTVRFDAPDGGLWKVQTMVHVDGKDEPLTMHRWIAASGS